VSCHSEARLAITFFPKSCFQRIIQLQKNIENPRFENLLDFESGSVFT
jgi:hypothetical protein